MATINKRFVDGAPCGRHYDGALPGFGIYVGATGAVSYFVEYRPGRGGRGVPKRRHTFARHGAPASGGRVWTTDAARREALRLLGAIKAGHDPLERAPQSPTFADLTATWLAELATKRKPRTMQGYERTLRQHALPEFGTVDIARIGRQQVARLHHALRRTPAEANYLVRVFSSFFTWCERNGYREDRSNPARMVTMYRERKRERFLSPRELRRLARALAVAELCGKVTPHMAAAIRLLVLTGARLGEVLALRWEWVDLADGALRLPDSKTGAKVIHLNSPARAVLAGLPRVNKNPFVIVGGKHGRPLVNLQKPWRRVRKAALLDEVRLHDLRHSHASVGVASGLSLPLIGGLLGHSKPATTARYAHLADDPLKAASELVGRRIAEAMEAPASAPPAGLARA